MKRTHTIGLVLVALLAASALGAAAASAFPDYFKGGSQLAAGTKIEFKSHNSAAHTPYLESTVGEVVKCTSSAATGEIEGPTELKNTKVVYKGCEKTKGTPTGKCTTGTKTAGEVETKLVEGKLIFLDSGKTKAGVLFKPVTPTVFAEFNCEHGNKTVEGEVIGEAQPINAADSEFGKLIFAQESGLQQLFQIEEAGAEHHLSAFGAEAGIGGGKKNAEVLTEEIEFEQAHVLVKLSLHTH